MNLRLRLDAHRAEMEKMLPVKDTEAGRRSIADWYSNGNDRAALQKGERAPLFVLPDAKGHKVHLATLLEQGPVVASFYRGEWCPYCNFELQAYQEALPEITALGASLIAISPEKPAFSKMLVKKLNIGYPALTDDNNVVARLYGILFPIGDEFKCVMQERFGLDLAERNTGACWEVPVPATFVIAPDRTVLFAHVDADFTHRAEPSDVLEALRGRGWPARTASGAQVI